MLFKRVNRAAPEQIFIVVRNSYSVSLTNGQAVIWDFTSDVDGVGVTRPTAITTNQGYAAAGIVAETIGVSDYGLIQVYGYHAAVRARACTSDEEVEKGTALALSAAGSVFCLEAFVSGTTSSRPVRYPCAFAMAAYSSWSTKTIKAFVKCL